MKLRDKGWDNRRDSLRDKGQDKGRDSLRDKGQEQGSGTVLVVAWGSVVFLAGVAVLLMGRALAVHHRVDMAADQAALAAADIHRKLVEGDACEAAVEVASHHRVRMLSCSLGEDSARVSVADTFMAVEIAGAAKAGQG